MTDERKETKKFILLITFGILSFINSDLYVSSQNSNLQLRAMSFVSFLLVISAFCLLIVEVNRPIFVWKLLLWCKNLISKHKIILDRNSLNIQRNNVVIGFGYFLFFGTILLLVVVMAMGAFLP